MGSGGGGGRLRPGVGPGLGPGVGPGVGVVGAQWPSPPLPPEPHSPHSTRAATGLRTLRERPCLLLSSSNSGGGTGEQGRDVTGESGIPGILRLPSRIPTPPPPFSLPLPATTPPFRSHTSAPAPPASARASRPEVHFPLPFPPHLSPFPLSKPPPFKLITERLNGTPEEWRIGTSSSGDGVHIRDSAVGTAAPHAFFCKLRVWCIASSGDGDWRRLATMPSHGVEILWKGAW